MKQREEHKRSIQGVADTIKDFRTSAHVLKILSAEAAYKKALQQLFESRLEASRHVRGILEQVEDCIDYVEKVSTRIPWDEENKEAKGESHREMEQLIAAKVHLELCVATLQVRDFDLDDGVQKDTLGLMDEAREFLLG